MKKALIFWFTGLSGSGKTTVATGVKPLLEADGFSVLILDGDDVRARLNWHLGFSEQDIRQNNMLIANLCRTYQKDYDCILVPIISPYRKHRKQARNLLGKGFFEIYFSADLQTVIKRDVKGLYSKAKRSEIHNLIGYSPGTVYESPQRPDFVVNSGQNNTEKSVNDFYKFVIQQLKTINQNHPTRKIGLFYLLRKGHALSLMILALPCVFLMRLLRPLVVIRLGHLFSRRIGHFLGNTDVYLCECESGLQGPRTFDIFYHYLPISNYQLKKMWERTKRLHILPFHRFMQIADKLNRLLPGAKLHTITTSSKDIYNLRVRTRAHLSFTAEEERLGRSALQKLGIPENAPFVCFHARDCAYLDTVHPNHNWRYQDYRDSSIHNYMSAACELARRGYFMVRMGAVVKEALNNNNPMIIDYAVKGRTDFLDIYLGAKCQFFICDSAGINAIPRAFRRPVVWVNFIHFRSLTTGGSLELFIPKKFWLRKERRFLKFREIIASGIDWFSMTEEYEQLGIELVENTPEEITALAVEMEERLKGTWQGTEEDEELKRRFWALFNPSHLDHRLGKYTDISDEELKRRYWILFNPIYPDQLGKYTHIGREFLRQNRELLD